MFRYALDEGIIRISFHSIVMHDLITINKLFTIVKLFVTLKRFVKLFLYFTL